MVTSEAIVSVVLSKYYDRKREIEQAQRANKAEIYEALLKFVFGHVFMAQRPDQAPSEVEGFDFFNRFTQRVIVWGSDDVLRQFSKWKFSMNDSEPNAVVFEIEKLLFAIRKDMGTITPASVAETSCASSRLMLSDTCNSSTRNRVSIASESRARRSVVRRYNPEQVP